MRMRGKSCGKISPPSKGAHEERTRDPHECPDCHGFGQTSATRTQMVEGRDGRWRTRALGSGCPRCLGTGRVPEVTCSRVH